LVLDEAGAVGTADMQRLFDLAHNRGARVVLSGDTGQHAAVAQGDALRLIEEHSRYRFAVLGEIRRQTKETFRQAVKLAADQDTGAAFKLLQKEGAVVESLTDEGRKGQRLYNQAAEAYLTATDAGKTALLISPTWGEIAAVTEVLRERLKERGTISKKEETHHVFDSLGWTDAQKGLVTHYEPGLQVRFVRKTEQFKVGEIAEVADVSGRTVTLRAPGGKTVAWHPSRSPASFDVGEARELAVASGDWLLLQANTKAGAQTFTNGERVQVKEVGREGIALKDGRTLPHSYLTFNYGYAVTSHAAQGKTVDVGLFVASSRSFAAVSRESFYVGISRAKEKVTVFTDDAATLSRRVQDAHTRKAALELDGLRAELVKNGLLRPREAERKKEAVKPAHRHEHSQRMSRALRALRVQRLAPVVAVQKWAQDFRRWVGERLGAEPVERLTPSQRFQRATRISAADQLRQRPDEPRQSRGIRM
jgi:ATP-dependent exoDNAse (exonuclease V) alpha subunit